MASWINSAKARAKGWIPRRGTPTTPPAAPTTPPAAPPAWATSAALKAATRATPAAPAPAGPPSGHTPTAPTGGTRHRAAPAGTTGKATRRQTIQIGAAVATIFSLGSLATCAGAALTGDDEEEKKEPEAEKSKDNPTPPAAAPPLTNVTVVKGEALEGAVVRRDSGRAEGHASSPAGYQQGKALAGQEKVEKTFDSQSEDSRDKNRPVSVTTYKMGAQFVKGENGTQPSVTFRLHEPKGDEIFDRERSFLLTLEPADGRGFRVKVSTRDFWQMDKDWLMDIEKISEKTDHVVTGGKIEVTVTREKGKATTIFVTDSQSGEVILGFETNLDGIGTYSLAADGGTATKQPGVAAPSATWTLESEVNGFADKKFGENVRSKDAHRSFPAVKAVRDQAADAVVASAEVLTPAGSSVADR